MMDIYIVNGYHLFTKRLQCAKNLLADDGLIFISIDDNEVADLKLICNEIFGEPNFRGQIVRSTGTPTGQGNSILVNEIDYILVYSRTDKAIFNGMPFSEEDAKIYNCEDEFGIRRGFGAGRGANCWTC